MRLAGKAMKWNVWIGWGRWAKGGKMQDLHRRRFLSLRSSRSIKCLGDVLSLPKSPVARPKT